MHAVVIFVINIVASFLPYIVARIVAMLGFGIVTYNMTSMAVDVIVSKVLAEFAKMPIEMLAVLNYTQFDKCLGIIFGAYAAAFTMKLSQSKGSFRYIGKQG